MKVSFYIRTQQFAGTLATVCVFQLDTNLWVKIGVAAATYFLTTILLDIRALLMNREKATEEIER